MADVDVLIIGAGMSGLGMAVQLVKRFPAASFELIEKTEDVGGTWLVNTYPGCGCDVPSHFYSYSFELNPDWSQKFSMAPEIQAYFRSIAEKYDIVSHTRFQSVVQDAIWNADSDIWVVTIKDQQTDEVYERRSKVLVSAVGGLSNPKECETPGAEKFQGHLFHSAKWDHSFDWKDKDVVVLGNGCSATQFVPIMSGEPNPVHKITQFSRQAHWISERENPHYSTAFKRVMRYVPLAMRLYRAKLYSDMERDYAGFPIESGREVREQQARENFEYVHRRAPEKYWDALIPKHEIGCKRKVLDTGYMDCLHRPNVELVPDDPVQEITEHGVLTESGREVRADAIVLAIGFATQQMLVPMKIVGEEGVSLNDHWRDTSSGAAQAYLGTCVSGFPNFFILMGPNTVTGHLSVIYTVECQINLMLRLISPILKSLHPSLPSRILTRSLALTSPAPASVAVTHEAAQADSAWIQREAKKLVWASGCTNWYVDAESGMNIMTYPDWQFWYWWRTVFFPRRDFVYRTERTRDLEGKGGEKRVITLQAPGWIWLRTLMVTSAIVGCGLLAPRFIDVQDGKKVLNGFVRRSRALLSGAYVSTLSRGA